VTLTHLGGGRAAAGAQAALLGRGVLSYARIMVRQLQSDVRLEEQVELTRLEGAASGSADEDPLSATAVQVVRAQLLEWDAAVLSGTRVAYAFALPSAGTAVEAVHRTQFGGVLRAAGQCEGGALGPMRARKTKRMDRRLTHWQCTFCRHETAVSEQVNTCPW